MPDTQAELNASRTFRKSSLEVLKKGKLFAKNLKNFKKFYVQSFDSS